MKPLKHALTALAMALLLAPGLLPAENIDQQATEKLARVKALAREILTDASILQTYAFTPSLVSKESHQSKLNSIRKNANEIGEILQSLQKKKAKLVNWQAQLLDRLMPRMQTIADDADSAIKFYNESFGNSFFQTTYEDCVDSMYNGANSIINTIDRYFEWAERANTKQERHDGG